MAVRRLRRVSGGLQRGAGYRRGSFDSPEDAQAYLDTFADVGPDYTAVFAVEEEVETETGTLPGGEAVRDWDALSMGTKARYLRSRRLRGLARRQYGQRGSDAFVIRKWYEEGGDLRAARGHQTAESYGRLREAQVRPRYEPTGQYEVWVTPGRKKRRRR